MLPLPYFLLKAYGQAEKQNPCLLDEAAHGRDFIQQTGISVADFSDEIEQCPQFLCIKSPDHPVHRTPPGEESCQMPDNIPLG